ncbi:cytidyltransferase-like domain-containing protein [Deinococcus irradiatisoli]|uniref:Cytidyltransferase-like domain-containing protein n=1 Tax=Deinococcus irradiatisoli TaxID=2202254 RepID=A0A2Z3JFW7_9DEIO|nr:AAA family ATPase [Deinococcus irradiatisoli]AWN23865.1 cytidyltransferase-like domain-containing protein [Deinococcus irradiatisoli]
MPDRFRHGLIVGKFAPLHAGHEALIRFALSRCERLSVWVYSRPDFPEMPSPLHRNWLREVFPEHLFPQLTLLPDAPHPPLNGAPDAEHQGYVQAVLAAWNLRPDVVVSSETYGEALATRLNAAHLPFDPQRRQQPISGTQLRADVHASRHFLSPLVYAHFVERIAVVGAESTGKSTLTAALAADFGTHFVREYGRDVYEREHGQLNPEHFLEIALGHRALEDEAARRAGLNRYLFVDTTAAATLMWSYLLCRRALPEVQALADDTRRRYAQTFLCADTFGHQQDGWRSNTEVRTVQQAFIVQDLQTRRIRFHEVGGSVPERVAQVRATLDGRGASPGQVTLLL